jgi:hypothetical protein
MAAPTVTSIEESMAAGGGPAASGMRFESFKVVPAGATDADISVPYASFRALSHVVGFTVNVVHDTLTVAIAADEAYYFDQTMDTTKNYIVLNSTNGGKIVRVLMGATALVSHTYIITFFGY